MEQEPDNKEAVWKQYFEEHDVHPLTGFQFDPSKVQNEIQATNAILKENMEIDNSYTYEYKALLYGDVEDVGQALDKLNEKLEAAGISKIIEEANRQVEEWKVNKKG